VVISHTHPDPAATPAARRQLFDQAATDCIPVLGVHFPPPGISDGADRARHAG
jgi:hypothetical protein